MFLWIHTSVVAANETSLWLVTFREENKTLEIPRCITFLAITGRMQIQMNRASKHGRHDTVM
jgi:hypothetical protein